MNTFSRSSASLLALSLALSVIACGGQVGDRNGSGDDNISSGGDAGSGGTGGNETGGDDPGGSNPGGSNPGGSTGGSSRSGIALFRYQLDNLGTGGAGGTGGIGTGGAGGDWGSSGTCGGGAGGTAGYAGGYDGGGAYAGAGGEPGGTGGTAGYYGGAAGVGGAGGSYGGSAGTGGYYGGSAGIGGEGGYYGGSAGSYGGTGAGAVAGAGGAPQAQTLFLFVDSTPNHAATQCWSPYEALPCGAWRVTVGIDPQLIHPGVSTFALSTPGIDAFFSSSGPGADPNSCAGWGGGSFIDGSITLNFDGSSVLKGSFEGTNGIDFNANGDFEVSWCP